MQIASIAGRVLLIGSGRLVRRASAAGTSYARLPPQAPSSGRAGAIKPDDAANRTAALRLRAASLQTVAADRADPARAPPG